MGKILKLTICLTVIAAFCAAVLAYVNASTKDAIKAIRAKQTLDAAKAVMPADVEKVERAQGAEDGGRFDGGLAQQAEAALAVGGSGALDTGLQQAAQDGGHAFHLIEDKDHKLHKNTSF